MFILFFLFTPNILYDPENFIEANPVAWRSGNALCRINEVNLRWARLVLGWVTVYGQVNHLGTKPAS